MRTTGALTLQIAPRSAGIPATVTIVLTGALPDERGDVRLTAGCTSLDDIEACINVLQDELDEMRQRARRAFGTPTH